MPHNLERLLRIPSVYTWYGGYDISPDGRHAVVAWDRTGQWQLWSVPLAGGEPRQLSSDPDGAHGPAFSPDGRCLAYGQDYGGDENYDILFHDLEGDEVRNLTPDTPDETINPNFSWSPDGRQVAFTSNREGAFAAYAISVADGSVRRLTQHAYSDYHAEWSPRGDWVAVLAHTHGQDTWTFLVRPDGSGESLIVGGPEGPVDTANVHWSRDGRRLAFSSNWRGQYDIGLFDVGARELSWVTESEDEESEPGFSPDGRRLAYVVNRDGNLDLAVKDLESGRVEEYRVEPGVHSAPRFTPDGKRLVFGFVGPRRPADLWILDLGTGEFRPLTHSLPADISPDEFVSPEVVRWENEGVVVSGLLYRPKALGLASAPAILQVHGGPTAQHINYWFPTIQHWVSLGYIVLAPNYRGSTGYGKAYQEANRFDLGGADMRDVIAGAQWLVENGLADPKRLGITGASYGGYLTMTALTRHPSVFAAGSAVVSYLNWFTEHANEREDLRYWDLENFGDPEKDADRYREYSPIFFMENIVAPVQLIAGANDPRCPAGQTEQAARALEGMGVPHEVIIFPDEGHGFRKVENKVRAYVARAEFFNRYLLGSSQNYP